MTIDEQRTEALKLALTYYKMRLERCNAAGLTPDFTTHSNSVVKTAEEFHNYIQTGKSYY